MFADIEETLPAFIFDVKTAHAVALVVNVLELRVLFRLRARLVDRRIEIGNAADIADEPIPRRGFGFDRAYGFFARVQGEFIAFPCKRTVVGNLVNGDAFAQSEVGKIRIFRKIRFCAAQRIGIMLPEIFFDSGFNVFVRIA